MTNGRKHSMSKKVWGFSLLILSLGKVIMFCISESNPKHLLNQTVFEPQAKAGNCLDGGTIKNIPCIILRPETVLSCLLFFFPV